MDINASSLNVRHTKQVDSIIAGAEKPKVTKNKFATNVDSDEEKGKKTRKDNAYKIDISKEGKARSQKLELDTINRIAEDTSEIKKDGETTENVTKNAMEDLSDRIQNTLKKIRSGKALSEKEQKWLEGEITSLAAQQYKYTKNLKLSREDERILNRLGANIKQRQRIFQNMLDQVNPTESKFGIDMSFVSAVQEQEQMKDEIEMIKESLEAEEDSDEDAKIQTSDSNLEQTDEAETEAETEEEEVNDDPLRDEKRAAAIVDRTLTEIDEVDKQRMQEALDARMMDGLLDSEYKYAKSIVTDNSVTLKEKADALEHFEQKSQIYSFEREAERNKAEYDAETVLMARIFMEQRNDLSEIIKRNPYKVNFIDQDTVIALLQR